MENVPARTLTENDAADWFAATGSLMGRVWLAVRAWGVALHKQPPRRRTRSRKTPAVHAAPSHVPAAPVERGELPGSYGRTKVVAMVVSPYLVHTYWDLAAKDAASGTSGSLRFHDTQSGDSFDVRVDLAARNWYVHLWSPDKHYSVELGVDHEGAFAPLARSNPVETPRAWPVAAVERPAPVSEAGLAAPQPVIAAPHLAAPTTIPSEAAVPAPQNPAPLKLADAMETLRQRLSQLHYFRRRPPRPADAIGPPTPEPAVSEAELVDLPAIARGEGPADVTGLLETQFSPGLSSVLLGLSTSPKPTG